ncbi:hypothetical protein Q7P36_008970 [Cladosporium allicinum]
MAKSKSTTTTTPTEASSSKTKDKDDTAGRRSSRINAGTTSNPTSPSKRKADDVAGGSRSSKRRAVADNNVSPSGSHTATSFRPVSSKGKGKEVVLPQLELFKQRHASLFSAGVAAKEVAVKEEPDADNICVRTPLVIDSDDRQRLLDFVLIDEFGSEARRLAVDQLFEAAHQSAASETDLGVTYIEATVDRLKRKGINEYRLVEVVVMLRDGLVKQINARLDSLGGPLPSPLSLPPSPPEIRQVTAVKIHNANSNDANDLLEASSSQKVPVVVSHNGKQRPARSESVHTPSESSDSSSDEDDTVVPGSQRSSRYRDDDDEDYAERSSRVARNQEHVKLEDGPTRASINNFRVYGTRHNNGRPFDLYARSAISACTPAPGDDATAMRIRGEALNVWRYASAKDKKDWKGLVEARNLDPDVHKKCLRLLRSQSLFARLKSNCQRLVNTTDPEPSRSAPAHLKHATTSSAPSGDAIRNQTLSDRSYSPPEFILSEHALSEHTTVAYPIFKETASAQCSSNRSSPPLKSVLPKHTSAVPPTLNNDATARSTSGQPPSSHTEPALSEHILAAHPIKDDSSSQDTSDQSSSSSSAPSSPEPTHPEPTLAEHQRSEDNVGAQGTSDQSSSSSSSSPPPDASFAQPASAAHSGSEDDASTQGSPVRSCSPSEHTVSEDESVAHSTSADNGSNQSTPWRSSSSPEHIISEHKPSKSTASTKGNSPSPSYLHFRADYSGPSNIGLFFPFLRRATSDTPNHEACYVSFVPRPGKKPSCLFVVSTPEGRTKKQLTDHDIRAGCSAFGLPAAKRVSKNMYTMSFPSQTAADISQMSAVIKLPSSTGGTVLLDAYDHRP